MTKTVLQPPAEAPTESPEPAPLAHNHVSPGYTARDYTNQATTVLTCRGCGFRAGWRTTGAFPFVKAVTAARKAGWSPRPDPFGGPPTFTCPED